MDIYEEYCKSHAYSCEDIFELMPGYSYHANVVNQDSGIVPITAVSYSKQGDVLFIHSQVNPAA